MHRTATVPLASLLLASALAWAHTDDLPAGPVHDRHELMERIGANAKTIGDALKTKDMAPIPAAAEAIAADARKAPSLFPPGSEHPKSRAQPEIWKDWPKFEALTASLATHAEELAKAAKSGGDAGAAAKTMFGDCKSCHDAFRKPEEQ
jgi:cytochrome c556